MKNIDDPKIKSLIIEKDNLKLDREDLPQLWSEIRALWSNNLKEKFVTLPEDKLLKSKKWHGNQIQLCLLYKYKGQLINKDHAAETIKRINYSLGGDQQFRHLGTQRGFYVLNKGDVIPGTDKKCPASYHMLVNLTQEKPGWSYEKRDSLQKFSFDDGEECFICGAIQGEPHPRNPSLITKLEAGHMDPFMALTKKNMIPTCSYCNKANKDKWVFDKSGKVKGFASANNGIKYIKGSPELIKIEIYSYLSKIFKEKNSEIC
jgi:hypothetical protein